MLSQCILWTILQWQSGASESATASVFCYYFKYLLLTVQMLSFACVGVCVCVCVGVCVCSSVWARETWSHNRGLCTANTYEHHHCVCNSTLLPFWAWTDGKTKDIINFTFILKAKALDYRKGALYFRLVLVVFGQSQCTGSDVNQNRLCLSEGGTVENEAFERGRG